MRLGGLEGIDTPCENSNTSDFNEIKNILLMFTQSQDLYLGVYTDLIFGNQENRWITYLTDLINRYDSEF